MSSKNGRRGLLCPICEGESMVCETRRTEPDMINRKRACKECGYTFRTIEMDKDMFDHLYRKKREERLNAD